MSKNTLQVALLVVLSILAVWPLSAIEASSNLKDKRKRSSNKVGVQAITGTWINLPYKDVRNKYTNPQNFDNTSPELWEAKVRELSAIGIEYLIFMEVANDEKAYYPSKLMPWHFDKTRKSPVEAILDEASKHNMKVFMSTGWAKNHDDNMQDPVIKARQLEIMEELSSLYKNHKAFYGWYLPAEDCLCPIFAESAVQAVNSLVEKANSLTPGKKTMISPYGIGLSDFEHPDFEKQLAKLKVDIIAYQDEVGCVRDKFTIPRLKKNWKKMREVHNRLNIELWANCETFTWEEATNDRNSALLPSAYSRLLSQQAAASAAPVDRIISFMFTGILEDNKSKFQLGQPTWSNVLYNNYASWLKGDMFWKLMGASFLNQLTNMATVEMIDSPLFKRLCDNKIAEENPEDENWIKLEPGHYDIYIDMKKNTLIDKVFIRSLNFNQDMIQAPHKIYIHTSENGTTYKLAGIKDSPVFPNNKHDAWIDGVLFEDIDTNARYVKVSFDVINHVSIDEIFVNPKIK